MESKAFKKTLLITISGPAGSGKSHCAAALAEAFSLPFHSAGSIFRDMAAEKGMTLEELTRLAEKDEEIDKEIDKRTEDLAKEGGVILEGRLVAFFSPPGNNKISFYLTASMDERVKRIADRESISLKDAKAKTSAREEGERRRYKKIYGLNIGDLSHYDIVINTSLWGKGPMVELMKSIVDLYLRTRTLMP